MGRPPGSRSRDHEARRQQILARIVQRLVRPGALHPSYRELAEAGEVSLSTLQHYFGRRDAVIAAVFDQAAQGSAPHLAEAREPAGNLAESVAAVLGNLRLGFEQFGLADLHVLGLAEGLRHATLGPMMVETVLEPTIAAVTARLAAHQSAGQLKPDTDPRNAALMLLLPVVMLLLHQRDLGGGADYPIDLDQFLHQHVQAFVLAHGVSVAT